MAETTNQGRKILTLDKFTGQIKHHGSPVIVPFSHAFTDASLGRKIVDAHNAVERHLGGDASLVGELVELLSVYAAADSTPGQTREDARTLLAKIGRA